MTPLFIVDLLADFSPLRLGPWAFFLIAGYYLWKGLRLGRRMSSLIKMVAFALIVLGADLASGVLTGFDFGRLMGLIGTAMEFAADLLNQIGVLGA